MKKRTVEQAEVETTKEVKLTHYIHSIKPDDTQSKLAKAREQYYIRATMHQPIEARQALWRVRMYERQLYNPGAMVIDRQGNDFVSPHPLTRLQEMSFLSVAGSRPDDGKCMLCRKKGHDGKDHLCDGCRGGPYTRPKKGKEEKADCFPSYDVVKKSAAGKGISPESLQKAYQRVLKTKGQGTKLNSLRRKRTTDEIIEKASFYDLVEGRTKVIAGVTVVNPSKALVELAESEAKKLGALLDSPTFKADIREFFKRVPKEQLDKLEYELNELKKALDARKRRAHASSDDLVEETAKANNYPSFDEVLDHHVEAVKQGKMPNVSNQTLRRHYDAHKKTNSSVGYNGWSKKDWAKDILAGVRRKQSQAVKETAAKKKARPKGPSPGQLAFDKKIAATKKSLTSYHASRYWKHRGNKLKHADAHKKAMAETTDKAGASLSDNLWYHPAGNYEIRSHLRAIQELYSGKFHPPKPKSKK